VKISYIAFVGLANIGLQGIPGVTLQIFFNKSISFLISNNPLITLLKSGYSHTALLIAL